MSSILFHGPTAREVALTHAEKIGRLLAPPFGDMGLKVETSREIVEMLSRAPIGDRVGTVMIGPVDRASSPEAVDALLKTLEEFNPKHIHPVLWAMDVGEVLGTIRSRCVEEWCPAVSGFEPEAPYFHTAESLCEAALRRKTALVIEILAENGGTEVMLLRAASLVLVAKEGWSLKGRLKLWESLRIALRFRDPSPRVILAAFLV